LLSCFSDLPVTTVSEIRLLLDLAPKEVFTAVFVTKNAVSSYPTISPLPVSRRYFFCCTICQIKA